MSRKFGILVSMIVTECGATEFAEVIFNGCSNTPNDYFTFTGGGVHMK